MECMLLSARTGNAYYTQLFNKWLFYPLPCTVWTWTLDNVGLHTYFCDILRATLKLNLTWGRIGNTKQPNRGCWPHGTFLIFMWAVLILGCVDHFPTISFWTINWHTGYFNLEIYENLATCNLCGEIRCCRRDSIQPFSLTDYRPYIFSITNTLHTFLYENLTLWKKYWVTWCVHVTSLLFSL